MKADLINYKPENVEYVLEDGIKDIFPLELDFLSLADENLCGEKPLKTKADVMKFVNKHFIATQPDNELVTRYLDDFEKSNIREEYCMLEENEVPARKQELEEALEKAKKMKKDAEEAYASVLMEVAKYAAEVRLGTADMCLKSKNTICLALAGHYLVYNWDSNKSKFMLAKAYEIPDPTEIWANETKNRESMKAVFGLEFPETEQPHEEPATEQGDGGNEDLPFGE